MFIIKNYQINRFRKYLFIDFFSRCGAALRATFPLSLYSVSVDEMNKFIYIGYKVSFDLGIKSEKGIFLVCVALIIYGPELTRSRLTLAHSWLVGWGEGERLAALADAGYGVERVFDNGAYVNALLEHLAEGGQ